MKIPAIKKLVESYTIDELKKAEEALYDEQSIDIDVDGEDEGEKLTHILAAIDILSEMEKGTEFTQALRNYTQRVRKSIS